MGFVVAAVKVVAAVVAKSAKLAATAIISKVATKSISKLIAKRSGDVGSGTDAGARVQLPPASDNKLPIVYGSAWVSGPIFDAKISVDQKYMWYAIALCEKPDSQLITFSSTGVYWGGRQVNFGTNGAVASLSTNSDPVQTDTRMANKIYIWLFQNGANNPGINSGGLTPTQIMSDSVTGGGIPDALRWNGGASPSTSIYTSNGQSVQLDNMAFAIVRVEYNPDAGTTGLDSLQVLVRNNMGATGGAKPGVAILDYLTNTRYGCGIPLDQVDTASLTALDVYADQTIEYIPDSGSTTPPLPTQRRYRVNGPLDTANPCLTNLQFLADSCDSWVQYTETTGKWRIVPNKPYTGTLSSLYNVNDDVLLGGIQINPIDLNDTYNQVEVAYPNTNVKDQTDYQIVDLTDPTTAWYANFNSVLSPNEAVNRLNISLPLVNNAVQAKYLAVRRLLQSREDLVISCVLDYSGIQIDAGDVIRVNHNSYGWTDKLFRVSSVNEVQDQEGNLLASIEAFEYNGDIYDDNAILDFIPADNTGLTDPNVISPPCPPTVTDFSDANALVTGFTVETCVPEQGTVLYMDFNYGTSNNVANHLLYRTVQAGGGQPFVNSPDIANANVTSVSITVNDLPAANYYWSATARNDTAGRYSDGSAAYTWGGANIQPYNPNTSQGGLNGNQYQPNSVSYNTIGNTVIIESPVINYGYVTADVIGNITYVPVDLSTLGNVSTANFDTPKFFNVAYTGGGGAYPFYSGTSDINDGWQANSISPLDPAEADQLVTINGYDNFFALDYAILPTPVSTQEQMVIRHAVQLTATGNCDVQLAPFVTFTSTPDIIITRGEFFSTYRLVQDQPLQIITNKTVVGSGALGGGGILIRTFTSGVDILALTGSLNLNKQKK
jgi:hypothetical protein